MTSITRNLPWFIKDLGVYIVGDKCYVSLVENLNIEDVDCLKYSLSKGLGIGIVVGGSIMKVPQLLLILRAHSARGLSLPAYVLETLAYAITTAYSWRNSFPFSTYGENFFLTIQNVIITLLIIQYAPSAQSRRALTAAPSSTGQLASATVAMIAGAFTLAVVPHNILALLQLSTLPLSLFSKLPQIMQNHRARSTGQLSAFAVLAQIGGCAARLFTTATEVDDVVLAAGFLLALLLNIVLGIQLYAYWGKDEVATRGPTLGAEKPAVTEKEQYRAPEPVDIVVAPQSPGPYSPSQTGSYGRKWARKVD
ncbi:mannose-P-dolichol utilization defect 1 protein [Dentipellis sp. KUC8613]|nr:mannose-P-dolichol utilization defect 1 protein [Dentipellis sp. KUC8613]